MFEKLLSLDRILFLKVNSLGTTTYDPFWLAMSNSNLNIFLYSFITLVLLKKISLKSFFFLLLCLAILILSTDQSSNLMKWLTERLRPCHDNEISLIARLVKNNCGGKYSFFSAHASNSFGLATFFSLLLKPIMGKCLHKLIACVLFVLACLIAISRVYLGVHFPSDIIVGMFVGMGLSIAAYKLYVKYKPAT